MTDEIITADPSLIDLLKEGDGRKSPSVVIEARTSSQAITVSVDEDENVDDEEKIKREVEGNLRRVIDYGNEAIKDLSDLASSSEHPRPYEALSALMKSVVDANTALLDVRKQNRSLLNNKRTNEDSPVESKEDILKASVGDLLNIIDAKRRATDKDVIDVV